MGQVLPITVTNITSSGSVAAGKRHIEFILSSDFAGTIGGVTMSGTSLAIYSPGTVGPGYCFDALAYTISAGSAILTTW